MRRALLFFLSITSGSAFQHSSNGTSINVLGQSGKVSIERGSNSVVMQIDKLYEVAGDEYIGTSGQDRHSVISFATQNFQFTPLKNIEYNNVSVDEFYFYTPIYSIGMLDVRTMLINEVGTLGTETESWQVAAGDLKWNIELRDWTFLPEATAVEIHIEIKGSKEKADKKSNTTVEIGGATLQLSNRVTKDGVEVDMPQGYPRIETQGSKEFYIFRFPRFDDKIIYDPVMQLSDPSSTSDASGATAHVFILTLPLLISCFM